MLGRAELVKPCRDCPFNRTGPGASLRRTLRPGRWRGILRGLRAGGYFWCHNTTHEDEDGEFMPERGERLCAGAIRWQAARRIVAPFVLFNRMCALARRKRGTT